MPGAGYPTAVTLVHKYCSMKITAMPHKRLYSLSGNIISKKSEPTVVKKCQQTDVSKQLAEKQIRRMTSAPSQQSKRLNSDRKEEGTSFS